MSQSVIAPANRRVSAVTAKHPYLTVTLMIAAVTAFGLFVLGLLRPANVEALYLLVVVATALQWGRRPALFAAMVSTTVFDYCFIPPRFSFAITDLAYFVLLSVFVVVALMTSELTSRAHDLIREQAARAQAEAARTLAEAAAQAKDALLDRIAHELRAPLTTILGWVQILGQTTSDVQRNTRGLAGLERNAQLLLRLVGDLLDLSRIHVGKLRVRLQPVALAPIVRRVLDDTAIAAAEKGIQLRCGVEPVGIVRADEHRIEQVVTNLVTNALKFTPEGGSVSVTLTEANGCARLSVADSGEGIPPEFVAHVFEPFSQGDTQNSPQGLGLGLAIVKHLVDAHHGRLTVESAGRGQGTTFVVEFPFADTPEPAPANRE